MFRFIQNLFVQDSSNIFAENRLLKIGFFCLVLYSAVITVQIQNMSDSQKTHIVPIGGRGNFVLSSTTASDDYLRAMSEYVVHMIGNLSAATARRQLNEVLTLIHPEKYTEYQQIFNKLADGIERYPTISYVVKRRGNKDLESVGDDTLQIKAVKNRIVGDSVTRHENVTYELMYKMEQGRFWLLQIQEIPNA